MAQIDELIAAMKARGADALILKSDQPAQLNFGGTLANAAVVPAALLREMLCEILPAEQKFQLVKADDFEFVHPCASGLMLVQISGRDAHISLTITAYQAHTSQPPYFPVSGSRYASAHHKTPDLSKLGSAVANSTQISSVQKPTFGWPAVLQAMAAFCFTLFLWMPILGTALTWLCGLAAIAIYLDAHLLGARYGLIVGSADKGPWGWMTLCLAMPFIGIPAYLMVRRAYKNSLPPARVPPP